MEILSVPIVVVALIVVGVFLVACSWKLAGGDDAWAARSHIFSAIGTALVTGLVVSVAFAEYQEEGSWRASVATADSIPGFTKGEHSLDGLVLSGKALRTSDLVDADLRGVNFRDTDLRGSDLTRADLRGANLIGADLRNTRLDGARLDDADLHAADLRRASVENVASLSGATASATTKWPCGFLSEEEARGLRAAAAEDGRGGSSTGVGTEVCQ
jgi:hypothetical protein